MQFFYIANIRMPTERAHGIQVAKMCEFFARNSAEVTLLVPDRKTIDTDPFEYYGVERNFRIEKVPVPDVVRLGKIGFFVESVVFAYRAARRVKTFWKENTTPPIPPSTEGGRITTVVYTREELPLLFLPRSSAFYEAHQLRRSYFFRWLIKRAKGVIAITRGLKDKLIQLGIPAEKILVAHDGFDEKMFAVHTDKNEARKKLGLPTYKKIAMYIGGLEDWKGSGTLLEASDELARSGIIVAVIGGTEKEIAQRRARYTRASFLGSRPYRELPANQLAADVLVIPNSGRARTSREFTSPLKLFAHMASAVPIVASRIPSLCEVLSDETAYLVAPDDSRALANGIRMALRESVASAQKAKKAAETASAYSWDKRAKNVLVYMR